jgi:hypothetical protein
VALGFNGRGVKLVHGFRALYAHRLRERGAPLDAIKNLLGHSDIKVTEGYFPASQTRERAAVALLDGALPNYYSERFIVLTALVAKPLVRRAGTRTETRSH